MNQGIGKEAEGTDKQKERHEAKGNDCVVWGAAHLLLATIAVQVVHAHDQDRVLRLLGTLRRLPEGPRVPHMQETWRDARAGARRKSVGAFCCALASLRRCGRSPMALRVLADGAADARWVQRQAAHLLATGQGGRDTRVSPRNSHRSAPDSVL